MRKKLFAILMSAMMMVTFMPSMAFASDARVKEVDGLYTWTDDAGIDHAGKLVEKVAPTCASKGYYVYECTTSGCGARFVDFKDKASHAVGLTDLAKVKMTPEAYLEAQIKYYAANKALADAEANPVQNKVEELTYKTAKNITLLLTAAAPQKREAVMDEIKDLLGELDLRNENSIARQTVDYYLGFYPQKVRDLITEIEYKYMDAEFLNTVCYVFAGVCPDCGVVTDFVEGDVVYHNPNKKVAACASSFVCKECKKTIISKADNSDNIDGVKHLLSDVREELGKGASADATKVVKMLADAYFFLDGSTVHTGTWTKETAACGANVYSMTCTKCGEKVFKDIKIVNKATNHNLETVTVLKPTCVTPGLEVQRCKDCGALTLKGINITKAKGHNKTAVTVAPTCGDVGYTVDKCADCGLVLGVIKNIKQPTGHKYKVETLYAPTCDCPGLVKVSCENCTNVDYFYDGSEKAFASYTVDSIDSISYALEGDVILTPGVTIDVVTNRVHGPAKDTNTIYYTGFGVLGLADGLAQKIVIPSTKAVGSHEWNGWKKVKDADCVNAEIWCRECNTCGYVDVHAVDKYVKNKPFSITPGSRFVGTKKAHDIVTKVVPATCGTAGYSYKVCAGCGTLFNEYDVAVSDTTVTTTENTTTVLSYNVVAKGTSGDATVTPNYKTVEVTTVVKTALEKAKFNKTAPLVEAGAKCNYAGDFKVVKARTIFEAGCQAHTCSVCGAIGPDLHELNKLTYTAPAVTAGSKKATVKVENKKDAVQYTIQVRPYGKANAGKWQNVKTVKKGGKVTVKKTLKSGKKFNFRICATRADGKKAYSKVTKGVKIK